MGFFFIIESHQDGYVQIYLLRLFIHKLFVGALEGISKKMKSEKVIKQT